MKARDLAAPYPTVRIDTPMVEAARLLAGQDLPGLIVVNRQGEPFTVLPGTQVLRMAIPRYCQEDPTLARVIDEAAADLFLRHLGDRTVVECLPERPKALPVVDPNATVLEIAAVMAATATPLVAVLDDRGGLIGAITLDALLDRMFAA
ncbi:MAG: CBS domain-containing protein [Micromonosporaceae bacterium]|nr:CBS domain-containing protein [Micromonosporaceae bacterium]